MSLDVFNKQFDSTWYPLIKQGLDTKMSLCEVGVILNLMRTPVDVFRTFFSLMFWVLVAVRILCVYLEIGICKKNEVSLYFELTGNEMCVDFSTGKLASFVRSLRSFNVPTAGKAVVCSLKLNIYKEMGCVASLEYLM
uniref:Uncharacterized protein n=1 Tax=Strigamia maritima TaxID=126957 RepID=T1JNQ6_STRMM